MKTLRCILICCAISAMSLATGCNQNTPICADNALQAPELIYPQDQKIISTLNPFVTWRYPDSSCQPENYRVDLYTEEDAPQAWTGVTNGATNGWNPQTPLLPGMMYGWRVRSFNEIESLGILSLPHYFYTGPMCELEDLYTPIPIRPYSGSTIDRLTQQYMWEYPSPCLPDTYHVEVATDMEFSNIVISQETSTPSIFWDSLTALNDCTDYFWHVAARVDGNLSPYSESIYFHIDREDECPANFPAIVRGMLWYDQCSVPPDADPVPSPLPAGCVVDSYGVDADGIHQAGEPNILNVIVQLAPGECPQDGTQSSLTDVSGNYTFVDITPGIYCLHVDATQFPESGGTGHWTLVAGDDPLQSYRTIFLSSDDLKSGQNFAWYQHLPEATETPSGMFTPDFNVYCRIGDNPVFDVLDVAMKATPYLVDGRNRDGTWFRLMLTATKGCWVPADSGSLSADISKLRVLYSIATPTPTIVNCSSYTNQTACEAQPACAWKSAAGALQYTCTNR